MIGPRRRDRILIGGCTVVTAAIIVAMTVDFSAHSTLAVDSIDHAVPVGPDDTWSIEFVGDTMLSDGAQPLLDAHGYGWTLSQVKGLLDGDFVIANLEAPIGVQTVPADPGKSYSYNSKPAAAAALAAAGVDAVGLGNNHSMDMGVPGLRDTQRFARTNGMVSFGAGGALPEAERPLLLHSDLGTVGIVALGENFGKLSRAAVDHAGTVVFSPESVQRGYDLARAAGADWVVAYVHWGDNYMDTNLQQRYWARMLVDAGYDLVVGSGPHISGPMDLIHGVPVLYSLGNFAFGAPGRFKGFGREGIGLIFSLELHRHAPTQLTVRCILTDNLVVDFVPKPCSPAKLREVAKGINHQFFVEGDRARMPCDCFRERQG